MQIDATNKKIGRLASEIAKILQGKDSVDFRPEKEKRSVKFILKKGQDLPPLLV